MWHPKVFSDSFFKSRQSPAPGDPRIQPSGLISPAFNVHGFAAPSSTLPSGLGPRTQA